MLSAKWCAPRRGPPSYRPPDCVNILTPPHALWVFLESPERQAREMEYWAYVLGTSILIILRAAAAIAIDFAHRRTEAGQMRQASVTGEGADENDISAGRVLVGEVDNPPEPEDE